MATESEFDALLDAASTAIGSGDLSAARTKLAQAEAILPALAETASADGVSVKRRSLDGAWRGLERLTRGGVIHRRSRGVTT